MFIWCQLHGRSHKSNIYRDVTFEFDFYSQNESSNHILKLPVNFLLVFCINTALVTLFSKCLCIDTIAVIQSCGWIYNIIRNNNALCGLQLSLHKK